jgi:DNA-directed RNA polymerase specialized sigma24 family protein
MESIMTDAPIDSQTVGLAMEGDRTAQGHLAASLYPRVFRFHERLSGGTRSEVEEFTQETMVRAFLSLAQLRDRGKVIAWVYRIALNVRRDYFRRPGKVPPMSSSRKVLPALKREIQPPKLFLPLIPSW